MAKKGGFMDNPFGGFFDFDGDGKEDLGEQWIAYQIFRECTEQEEYDDYTYTSWRDFYEGDSEFDIYPEFYETEEEYIEALYEAKYAWRETCEDGSEFHVYPKDYETEDEYNDALEEARYAWRFNCEDGSGFSLYPENFETEEEYNEAIEEARLNANTPISITLSVECPALDELDKIKESDYPNKRRYNAAYDLTNKLIFYRSKEYEKKVKDCCRFIIDKADTVLAANYLSHESGFLYSQAIKDNFVLPVFLPDEDESKEVELYQILAEIAEQDIPLSFKVWSWCLEKFMPYAEYDDSAVSAMTSSIIEELYNFPDTYNSELVRYMDATPSFAKAILDVGCEVIFEMSELIVTAIKDNLHNTALRIFKATLAKAGEDYKKINRFCDNTISCSKDSEEVETMEFFRDNMFPMIKAIHHVKVQAKVSKWEADIAEYIKNVVAESEKYTYSRENAWRLSVPNGKKYGLDPQDYDTEQEYLEALRKKEDFWRE